jgi:hypothetical protein
LSKAKIDTGKVNNSHPAVNEGSLKPQLTKPHAPFPMLATMVNNQPQPRKQHVLSAVLATSVNKV